MHPFRALVAIEAGPLTGACFGLIVLLLGGPEIALLTLLPFVLLALSGRHLLRWAIGSGRLVDETGLTLAFLDSDLLRKNSRRQDWAALMFVLFYLVLAPNTFDDQLIIAGAALWAVLGGLRLRVIIAFLLTERGASSADHDLARSPESVS